MESSHSPLDRTPQNPGNELSADGPKESTKDKKNGRAEMLAQAAIKDVKKPESLVAPKPAVENSNLETWFGSDKNKDADSELSSDKGAAETSETSDLPEHITEQEARQLVTEYVDYRLPVVEQEQSEAAHLPAEVAAITANKAFLERMRDEVSEESDEEIPAELLIDQAVTDVLEELGLTDSVAGREAEPVDDTAETETSDLPAPKPARVRGRPYYPLHASYEDEDAVAHMDLYAGKENEDWTHPADLHSAARVAREAAEAEANSDVEEYDFDPRPDILRPTPVPAEAPDGSSSDGGPHGSGGGPTGPGSPEDGAFGPLGGGMASDSEPLRPPITPNETSTARAERSRSDLERQQDMLRGMLVGGVVGYMIGRRRGRINTEKKFKPIQEQLQKEADTLRQTIANREQHIRTLAREKATVELNAQHTAAKRERLLNAPTKLAENPAEIRDTSIATILDVPVESVTRPEGDRPPIALSEVSSRSPQNHAEILRNTPSKQAEQLITPKAVEQMPLAAVIKAAESVMVGGKTLKSFYESGRIKEPALRLILTEHLRTGRTEKALSVALLSQERRQAQSFERQDRSSANDRGVSAQRQAEIEQHAEKFHNSPDNSNSPAVSVAAKDSLDQYEDSESALDVNNTQRNIGVVIIVTILVAVALFVYLH